MIILITGEFPVCDSRGHPTEEKELLVSHGVDEDLKDVVLPNVPPSHLGAKFSTNLGWYLE